MADRQKLTEIVGQVEYEQETVQKVTEIVGQVEYDQAPILKVTEIVGQAEYTEISRLELRWICAQVEYGEEILGPTQDQLLRHGTWFGDGIKQKMSWAT
jgi:hypothetical protein